MDGKIYFLNAADVAAFLKSFVKTTAVFKCRPTTKAEAEQNMHAEYVLEFTGGY